MGQNKYQVEEFVKDAVFQLCDAEEIKKSSRLAKDLGLSEDDIIEISTDIENEFNIDVFESDIEEWTTVRDIIKFVLNNTQEQEW